MRSTFKLTLAAIAVSFVITGCKSSHGPSVVAKNSEPQPIQITKEKDKKEESNKANNIPAKPELPKPVQPAKPVTPAETPKQPEPIVPTPEKPAQPEQPAQPDIPKNKPYASGINEDSKGQAWRVVALSRNGSLLNISEYRKDHLDSLTKSKNSPLGNSEEFGETEYNHFLSFELGQNEQGSPFIKNLNQKGNNYLGQHSGIYQDSKIVGDSNKINYLYVNQPYSSYGALFTDANNSNLFHVQLSTGRDGRRIISEGESGASYAEYGVYTLNGQTAKWNNGLVGDAVYQGNVIARIEKQIDNETVVFAPQVDGDVTLNLHLDNNWTDSKLSGKVNSTTIGEIKLEESKLAPATYLVDHIGFNGEAKANNSLKGFYSVEFAGPKLNDAVGSIELENETGDINNNDITKYNAVFGAVKTEK
ncbi:Uncharacterised protein [Actinobacillus lignieresii]|uniref:hypothetical protein n=1 Tax=Actinobacillus lignieresii TaxID=720 RepID=UPI000F6F39EF|nr:hypothetical protein [Actinobacillus lignieresii]VEB25662.1 Uncharacterised protein [Actinobacillus lignieresii]